MEGEEGVRVEADAQEAGWIDYTVEEGEVKQELADHIFNSLLLDTVHTLNALDGRDKRKPLQQAQLLRALA